MNAEGCSGESDEWCPIHGYCSCPMSSMERLLEVSLVNPVNPDCRLHGELSQHEPKDIT